MVPSDLVIIVRSVRDRDDLSRKGSMPPSPSRSGFSASVIVADTIWSGRRLDVHRRCTMGDGREPARSGFLPPSSSLTPSGLAVVVVTSTGAASWVTREDLSSAQV